MNLLKAKWFMKLDIGGVYNLIHMAEGRGMENHIPYLLWLIPIIGYALCPYQYPSNIPKLHERHIGTILGPFLYYLSR
jgi:hypothetical protein